MLSYIARRLLLMVPLIFGITLISFSVIHLAPGGPVEIENEMSMKTSAQARENLKKLYGLDKPLHVQYIDWLTRFVKLDFGKSFVDDKKVIDKIRERVPITIVISVLSLIITFCIAVPIGVLSATRQFSLFDKLTTVFVMVGFSAPHFWIALLCMYFFGMTLGWLPVSGIQSIDVSGMGVAERLADWSRHLILPVLIGASGALAGLSRYSRSSMLEVIRQDYIRTARAKGLKESQVMYAPCLEECAYVGYNDTRSCSARIYRRLGDHGNHLFDPRHGAALFSVGHVEGLSDYHGNPCYRSRTYINRQLSCRYCLCPG